MTISGASHRWITSKAHSRANLLSSLVASIVAMTLLRRQTILSSHSSVISLHDALPIYLWEAPDIVIRYLKTGAEALRDAAWIAAWDAWDAAKEIGRAHV